MPEQDTATHAEPLDALVLALLAADGPDKLMLTDTGSLHRLLASAGSDAMARQVLPRLGYRPDPILTRRVVGLDDAMLRLAGTGRLRPKDGGWSLSTTGRAAGKRFLRQYAAPELAQVRELAERWRAAAVAETGRRLRASGLQATQHGS